MYSMRRLPLTLGLVGLAAAIAAGPVSGGLSRSAAVVKPVIGRPITVPARPLPGKPLVVSSKVTRSDTGARLTTGKMICEPSIGGKVIRHAESFKGGIARVSFIVPMSAEGKVLNVKLTIRSGGQSATKVLALPVKQLPKPSASIGDASAAEANSVTSLSFAVTLSAATPKPVSIRYATADGTAAAGSDYTAASGTLTFEPGEKAKTITVNILGDQAVEQNETFTVALSDPVNATIADGSATATITNDDVAPRSGHYTGTTSQGKSIAFDVAPDLATLTNVVFSADLTVAEAPLILRNFPVELRGVAPIQPDWSFGFVAPYDDADMSLNLTFRGQLSTPGSASGTFRLDMTLKNVEGFGTVHASSGDVTWQAS
jgi:hypothetical protein